MICKQCGKTFEGTPRHKFCDECNRERARERARRYWAEHRDEYREYARRYYAEHRDEIHEQQKRYRWRKDAPK